MTIKPLNPTELMFATVCFDRIDPDLLKPGARELFQSLASQFAWHGTLSAKQLASLKKLKMSHDLAKRSDGIARGRISFDDDARTDAKLNCVYNPINGRNN